MSQCRMLVTTESELPHPQEVYKVYKIESLNQFQILAKVVHNHFYTLTTQPLFAQLAGAVEYTDCTCAEG